MDFAEFYRSTSPRTLRYAYGLTGDLAQAQDVVQEAYIRAWQRWRRLSGYDDAEAWLRLVVSRLAFDWWRRVRVRRNAPQPVPATVPAPSEDTVLVVAALKKIPERQRNALALHYLLDVPVAQIAADLGVAEGTVKSWLARGRDSLALVLKEELASVAMLSPEDVADRGRRRRRTTVAAVATAAGLAVLAVVVFATAILGRDRTMPPPPAVTPTGSPMSFSALQRVGGVEVSANAERSVIIQDGRAVVLTHTAEGVEVFGVHLSSGMRAWPPQKLTLKPSSQLRAVALPGAVAILTDVEIYVIDPQFGEFRWHMEKAADAGDVVFFPNTVVFTDRAAGVVTGYSLTTGRQSWQRSGPVQRAFGMLLPADLNRADRGIGFAPAAYTSGYLYIADGKGTIEEYGVGLGQPTGRRWTKVPPNDGFVAYNGEIFVKSAREMYRINLVSGRQTLAYSGDGVVDIAPCGAAGMCLIDATPENARRVVAVHEDRVKWSATFPTAVRLAPVGRSVRVHLDLLNGGSIVLDEWGHEKLRVTGPGSNLVRLDAGNILAYSAPSQTAVDLIGIPVATMSQRPLGTLTLAPGQVLAAEGPTVVAITEREVVVYRIA